MDTAGLPRHRRAVALIALALAASALPAGVHRTLLTAVFSFDQHPDLPLRAYAEGQLGIVQPTYARSYLYVAFRSMNGAPMTPQEAEQIDAYWNVRLNEPWGQGTSSTAAEAYDAARGALPIPWQAPEQPNSTAAAQVLAVDYVYYTKCSDDAFTTAAETLQARIDAFGPQSPDVAEWVRGQDFVFENCFGAGSGFIPPPAPQTANPLIRADRDYQIAAALFYSSRYPEAAAAFRAIAADQGSPWSGWGSYLAGRALLWEARTNAAGSPAYSAKLRQAAAQLRLAAGGDGPPESRDAARWLLARILMRTDPTQAASLLGGRLLSPLGEASRASELKLFTQLLNNLAEDPAALAKARASDQLVDWIFTFQGKPGDEADHAVERWRADGSVAWLAAALAKVSPEHADAPELVAAAARVQGHPGTPTLDYHRARILAEAGELDRARAAVDALIPKLRGLDSSRNRALRIRATLAQGAEDLLFYGVRPPAFVSLVFLRDGRYYNPWELARDGPSFDAQRTAMQWGPETAEILNESVPIDVLIKMLDVQGQPERQKTELLLAAWTRALLLERWDLVRRLAPQVGQAAPAMRQAMEALLAVTDPDRMTYFAASGLLQTPGASILLHSGPIRGESPGQPDPDGLNWWPATWPQAGLADYMPPEQGLVVKDEWNRIRAAGDGYEWLLSQAIAEAQRPDPHPTTPETLYRAVVCLNGVDLTWGYPGASSARSYENRARAVETLNQHFPNSDWTKQAAEALDRQGWY